MHRLLGWRNRVDACNANRKMNRRTETSFFSSFSGSTRLAVIASLLAGLLFACLMAIRLDLFKKPPSFPSFKETALQDRDTWMTIWQEDRRIGHSHRRLLTTDTGYTLSDHTVMKINTMGIVQEIQLSTHADLHADLSLSAFTLDLASNRFSFSVQGEVSGNTLHARVENKRIEIPLDGPVYIPAGMWDAIAKLSMQPGETIDLPLFDPVSLGKHSARVTFVGLEPVHIYGSGHSARKFAIDFMGAVETLWIDGSGTVLKEEGLLGITLMKSTRDQALDRASLSGSRDLTLAASVAAGMILETPDRLVRLKVEIKNVPEAISLDGGRQSFSKNILTITLEPLLDPVALPPGKETLFLEPAPFIESDHPEVVEAAKDAMGDAVRPLEKARNLVVWVFNALEKRPVLSAPTALETLRQRMGDCNEHAVLLAALSRAAGIPARVEAGLVYMDGRFYYHAWNSLYLGEWITADALMNQLPADVTHIRLVRGDSIEQAKLLGAVGNISLRILEAE